MLENIEGDSINEDELFGSGPAIWNQPLELNLRLPERHGRYENQAMAHRENRRMDPAHGGEPNVERNTAQVAPEPYGARVRPVQSDVSVNRPQPGPSQEVSGTSNTRDSVVRNKTTKNKENKIKNVNQRRQPSDVYEGESRHRQEEVNMTGSFRPTLQVKRHNIEQADRRNRNTVKLEKQTKNNSIAAAQGSAENTASLNGYGGDASYLLMNGVNPHENPRNVSAIYVRHRPNTGQGTGQQANRVDSIEYPIGTDLSIDNDENETTVKIVDKNNIRKIQNDLWGKKKQENSDVNLSSLNLQAPSLDLSFSNVQSDLETDEVPNRSPAVIQTSPVSQNQALIQSPIVLQYDAENTPSPCNNQISPSMLMQNNGLTLSLSSSGQISPNVIQSDSLLDSFTIPSSCYFGDGNSDRLYAQQVQQGLYGDVDSDLMARGLDISPDPFHYHNNLHTEQSREPETTTADHTVYAQRIHNDLYEPDQYSCEHLHIPLEMESRGGFVPEGTSNNIALPEPDGVRIREGHILSDQLYHEAGFPMTTLLLPNSDDITPEYSVQEDTSCPEVGEMAERIDDETFARILQEQLNLEVLNTESDEQYARYLQEMEDDDRYRERYRGRREPGTHQPLHTRYGRTWSRPLRVGHDTGHNVFDSRMRGRGTWDRPLQQQAGGHGGNEFAFLENVHDVPVREGYDIVPGAYHYRNEFDPDYMYGDRGEEYLVSININRDPHMLASLLMERAPDMMVPNDIDLNDYEALWELAEGLGEVRRVGMEQADISLLPVHTYQPPAAGDGENSKTDCLVCLNTFSQGEPLRTLPCCHIYHVDCIDEWLKRNAICPVCRQSAKQGEH